MKSIYSASLKIAFFCAVAGSLLSGCSGGGGGGGGAPTSSANGPVTSTLSFSLQSADKTQTTTGFIANFTVSGTCAGTGSVSIAPAMAPATFEGVTGFSADTKSSMSLSNCSTPIPVQFTSYYDMNLKGLGASTNGDYAVFSTPQTMPTTVTVGSTGGLGTQNNYTNITKTTFTGTDVLSYVVESDTASTAIVNFIDKSYDNTGALTSTSQDRYRIDANGALTPVSSTVQSGSTSHIVITYNTVAPYPWISLAPMPTNRTKFVVASVGSKVYAMSGISTTIAGIATVLNTVEVLDTATNTWTAGPSMPSPRAGATASVIGSKIYVIGGYNAAFPNGIPTVDVFDILSGTWSTRAGSSQPRLYAGSATIGNHIYVIGGTSTNQNVDQLFEMFNTQTGVWTTVVAPGAPTGLHPAVSALNGQIYFAGGSLSDTNYIVFSVLKYDPPTNKWISVSGMNYTRFNSSMITYNGQLWVFGGETTEIESSYLNLPFIHPTNDVESYIPAQDHWSLKSYMPSPLGDIGAVLVNGHVIAVGQAATYSYAIGNDFL